MNEKIKELRQQATTIVGVEHCRAFDREVLDEQKFAELIVRECMTICKEHPSRIVSNNWVADAVAPDIVSQFEEHFGVEE